MRLKYLTVDDSQDLDYLYLDKSLAIKKLNNTKRQNKKVIFIGLN